MGTAAVENSYTAPFLVDETDALDSFSISPPDAEAVKDCYIEINLDSPASQHLVKIRTSSASPFESAQTLIRAVLSLARGTTRKQRFLALTVYYLHPLPGTLFIIWF